jgi:hypothetical protein
VARFQRRRGLEASGAFEAWLQEHCLTRDELTAALRERSLAARLIAEYRRLHPSAHGRTALSRLVIADVAARLRVDEATLLRPLLMGSRLPWDGPLLRELKLRGAFRPALDLAGRIMASNQLHEQRNPDVPLSRLKRSRLNAWCAARWGVAESELEDARLERGFVDAAELDQTLRRVYAFERFGPIDPHLDQGGHGSPEALLAAG